MTPETREIIDEALRGALDEARWEAVELPRGSATLSPAWLARRRIAKNVLAIRRALRELRGASINLGNRDCE